MKKLLLILVLCAETALAMQPSVAQTVVAARTIRSKSQILATDVMLLENSAPGTFQRLDQVIGQEARVILYPGRPIRVTDIGPPSIIERNQIVTIIYSKGSLVITVDGRALSRGGLGDKIRVMNLASRTTVIGAVTGPAVVEVTQ